MFCRVQPVVSLYRELSLHGRQPACHHLFLHAPRTALRSRWHPRLAVFGLSVVNRCFGVKTPFTSIRGQGRHRKRPNRHDEGLQPVGLVIIHGLQTPNLGVSAIRVHR